MHTDKRTLAWLVAGILLVSITPLTMSAKAFAQSGITLNGAGATFPFPLIDEWRVRYQDVQPDVALNYQSIGSGGGIRQFTEKTVDFGATDAPLNANQTSSLPGQAVHIPETIGSVVAAYNVIGIPDKGLKLTGPILADIFLGKITKWDDPKIEELNPDLPLPAQDIVVVHRAEGSGTTFVWTSYLSKVSTEWEVQVGRGTSVQWPTGLGAQGNEGVATTIRDTQYAIGYVELAYALTTGMDFAFIENLAGQFIEPTLDSTRAAVAASAPTLPKGEESWSNVSLVNALGQESYPIASFSYLLLYKELSTNPQIDSVEKARALVDFVSWAITDGQEFADDLSYVPLPEQVVTLNQETLKGITFNGQPVIETTPPPPPEGEPFTVTTSLDGTSYTVTGTSTFTATEVDIIPEQYVRITFDGDGEVELTLPKAMIDGITTVKAGSETLDHEMVSSSASSTTIKFTVPEGSSVVDIQGAMIVPEFEFVALLILATAIVGVIGFTRFRGNAMGVGFGKRM
ncbi:MAG TPA: phosphate ABC transporter substrate-binding protein PstS [Nitrososphaera sp.]|jgi:phosphate transport system permease protein/phosphate transport system substrate-binding protein